jgi:hypothetical protein
MFGMGDVFLIFAITAVANLAVEVVAEIVAEQIVNGADSPVPAGEVSEHLPTLPDSTVITAQFEQVHSSVVAHASAWSGQTFDLLGVVGPALGFQ